MKKPIGIEDEVLIDGINDKNFSYLNKKIGIIKDIITFIKDDGIEINVGQVLIDGDMYPIDFQYFFKLSKGIDDIDFYLTPIESYKILNKIKEFKLKIALNGSYYVTAKNSDNVEKSILLSGLN